MAPSLHNSQAPVVPNAVRAVYLMDNFIMQQLHVLKKNEVLILFVSPRVGRPMNLTAPLA